MTEYTQPEMVEVVISETLAEAFAPEAEEGTRLLWLASLIAGTAVSAGRAVDLSPLFVASAMTAAANAVLHTCGVTSEAASQHMPPIVVALLQDGRVHEAVDLTSEAVTAAQEQEASDHAAEQLTAIMERSRAGRTQ